MLLGRRFEVGHAATYRDGSKRETAVYQARQSVAAPRQGTEAADSHTCQGAQPAS